MRSQAMQRNLMYAQFQYVQMFFESWGVYPSDEEKPEEGLSLAVLHQGINRKCYEKLLEDADRSIHSSDHGKYFTEFCRQQISEVDGFFKLEAETWEQLKCAWEDYVSRL